jgi:hypothetical protein
MKMKMLVVGLVIVALGIVIGWFLSGRHPDQKQLAATMLRQVETGRKFAATRPARLKPSYDRSNQENGDPMARVALRLVGVDTNAEAYWIAAINDPTLSAAERENLISDLNEDGLSDFKHPAKDDLVIIQNRIALVRQLMPAAMDQVNAKAFAETLADLSNLAEVARGRGKPVQ